MALPEGFRVRPVGVDKKNRLLLAGFFNPRYPRPKRQGQKPASLAVLRLLPSGAPDRTFGEKGWVLTPLASPLRIESATAALDPRGRLLVAGTAGAPDHDQAGFVLARYLLGP